MPQKIFDIFSDAPVIVYPNGGENITESSITIQWEEPSSIALVEDKVLWYEIFITEDYKSEDSKNLIQIASLPIGTTSFYYNIHNNFKGKKCRIAIRVVNSSGERGPFVFSANDFSVVNKRLPIPSIFKPVAGNTYFSYIPVIFDNDGVVGRCSQRSFYQMYYKSDSQEIDWTLGLSNIMVSQRNINWDVSNFPTASDYSLKFEMIDGDRVSEPVFVNDVTINNINYFLIDTLPPSGQIKIRNNREYINERDVVLELKAYDRTTGVKDYRIEQLDISSSGVSLGEHIGAFQSIAEVATWHIPSEDDGVKIICARFRDYADNTVTDEGGKYFRTYKSLQDMGISAFIKEGEDIWYAFGDESNPSNTPYLYKNTTLISSLSGIATALAYYDSILYIAIKDEENKGILQKYVGFNIESVVDNSEQYLDDNNTVINSLYESDSVINAMEVFNDTLFLGMQNGKLVSFKGSTVRTVNSDYQNIRSIRGLKSIGNFLLVCFDNSLEVGVLRVVDGNYVFTIVEIEE
jgi:hypothetical protein